MTALRALLFSNLFPSSREPTRAVFSLQRFTALASRCDVRLVAPLPCWSRLRTPRLLFHTPIEVHGGIEALYPTYWSIPGRGALHGRAMYASVRGCVRRLRREFPFDVILAAWAYPDAVAAAALAREFGCPLVTMVLGSDVNELAERPDLRNQIRSALLASRRVVAVSGALGDRVAGLGVPREQIVVQRNGVDGERFRIQDRAAARERLGLPLHRRIVCCVGNLKPEKGVTYLIEAANRMPSVASGAASLVLVGGGPLERALRAAAPAGARFAGRRPYAEIPDWMAAADVVCLPSLREGCPNVVLEALASGRPVVASEVGGVPELLSPQTGIMVPAADPRALARGLEKALSREWSPEHLRGSVPFLSWDQYGRTLHDVLSAAVAEHAAERSPTGLQVPAPARA